MVEIECPTCGKKFKKETEGRARLSADMHFRRAHGQIKGSPHDYAKPMPKRGGQHGNHNAMKAGLRSANVDNLPVGCSWIKTLVSEIRRVLEDAISERDGMVNDYQRCIIQTACRWEQHSLLAQRWLRENYAKLDHSERLAYSREIAKASAERDKCLKELELHKANVRDTMAVLYGDVVEPVSDQQSPDQSPMKGEPVATSLVTTPASATTAEQDELDALFGFCDTKGAA